MPNEPKPAKEKRTEPEQRHNAQGDHEGSAHNPAAFDAMNPAKQVPDPIKKGRPVDDPKRGR